jgi:membrane-bound lytic murein transglycosylase B
MRRVNAWGTVLTGALVAIVVGVPIAIAVAEPESKPAPTTSAAVFPAGQVETAAPEGFTAAQEAAYLRATAGQSVAVPVLRDLPQPPKGPPPKPSPQPSNAPLTAQDHLRLAYAATVTNAPARCHLPATLLAAIGQVESGSLGGRSVGADHRVTPAVYGPALTGGIFARIRDTDNGVLDGLTEWDRAVGPMQFIPSTWVVVATDGDKDGRTDPQNAYDAAATAGTYLCLRGRDLATAPGLRSAVLSYNASSAYLDTVLRWKSYFDTFGLASLGQVALPVANGTSIASVPSATPSSSTNPSSTPGPSASPTSTNSPSASTSPTPSTRGPSTSPTPSNTASPTGSTSPSSSPTPSTGSSSGSPTPTGTVSSTGSASPSGSPTGSGGPTTSTNTIAPTSGGASGGASPAGSGTQAPASTSAASEPPPATP